MLREMDDELLGIGAFALLTGLTITALRHYDDAGLLRPAHVDDSTRYRYYRRSQLREAHVIRSLRAVDVPLAEIADALVADAPEVHALLVAHRDRLLARSRQLSHQLASLDELIEKGIAMDTATKNRIVMINVAVEELEPARTFYEALLEVEFAEEQHEDGPRHLNATFGEWQTPSWFLLSLWPDPDRAGSGDLGLLVENLDAAYERALAAGGAPVSPPHDAHGMPRNAQLRDPSGNHVGLYQS